MIGRVKTVRSIEGYGFIASEDGVDRFFHRTACISGMVLSDTLLGLYVDFEPALRPKGPCAVHVMLLPNTPTAGIPIGTVVPSTAEA